VEFLIKILFEAT